MNYYPWLGYLFISFLTLKVITQLFLNRKNQLYINKNKDTVPSEFADSISSDDHLKAAQYSSDKLAFSRTQLIFDFVLTLVMIPGGLLNYIDGLASSYQFSNLYTGLLFFGCLSILSLILNIPFSLYSHFVIEEKFGFNKMTKKLFFTDMLKQIILGLLIGAPFLYGLLYIIETLGKNWWLYAWAFLTVFQFFIIWCYPKFIAPLFNKFSKLDDSNYYQVIKELCDKIDFQCDGVFVMDASKRSAHGNAYFTGFGKAKRIVFFDNLLKSLSPKEVEAVLAHELGHFKKKHILKMMLMSLVTTFLGLALLGHLYSNESFFQSLFVTKKSSYMAFYLFSVVSPAFTFFFTPLRNYLSRKHEFEADEFAATHSNAADLIKALVKLYKENSSSLTPDPLYTKFYYSHPPALERVEFLNSFQKLE